MPFLDRADAGRRLAGLLADLRGPGTVVLGLPRGGIPVGYEIARALGAPLDVILVRKVGLPAQPELAMGAIGEDGVRVRQHDVVAGRARQRAASSPRSRSASGPSWPAGRERYRADRPRVPLAGRTAIVVDDGIATGSTARAACQVARAHGAARVVLAVPVAPRALVAALASVADEVVCVEVPEPFLAIGQWYQDFAQTSDARRGRPAPAGRRRQDPGGRPGPTERDVIVLAGTVPLPGRLTVPPGARHGGVRARQRQQPQQPAQHVRGRDAARGRAGHPAVRPAHPGGGSRPVQRVRHRPAGRPAVRGHQLAARAARAGPGSASATSGPAPGRPRRCGRRPSRAATIAAIVSRGGRPDLAGASLGAVRAAHPAHRGRAGRPGARAERGRPGAAARREPARRWSRARATCSPSRARWSRWPRWPGTGSPATCCPASGRGDGRPGRPRRAPRPSGRYQGIPSAI